MRTITIPDNQYAVLVSKQLVERQGPGWHKLDGIEAQWGEPREDGTIDASFRYRDTELADAMRPDFSPDHIVTVDTTDDEDMLDVRIPRSLLRIFQRTHMPAGLRLVEFIADQRAVEGQK